MKVAPSPSEMTPKEKIIGIGNVKLGTSPLIENLVDDLKHNLLSVSQLCDKGFNVVFNNLACSIIDRQTNACIFFEFRENNVYMIDMSNM